MWLGLDEVGEQAQVRTHQARACARLKVPAAACSADCAVHLEAPSAFGPRPRAADDVAAFAPTHSGPGESR